MQELQEQYKDYIVDTVSVPGVQTRQQKKTNWPNLAEYSDETADTIICKTKAFMKIYVSQGQEFKDFADWVSGYLADYFGKSAKYQGKKSDAAMFLQNTFLDRPDDKEESQKDRNARNQALREKCARRKRNGGQVPVYVGTSTGLGYTVQHGKVYNVPGQDPNKLWAALRAQQQGTLQQKKEENR